MKKELIHFIRWEKVQEKGVESVLAELPEWGVENIVAHHEVVSQQWRKLCKENSELTGKISSAFHGMPCLVGNRQ